MNAFFFSIKKVKNSLFNSINHPRILATFLFELIKFKLV
ncbi:hypothetical protein YPPY13_0663 [Yersinia pestis PY-13]|uniref:Uncharacterized protein n=2 Tax=Yersinia pestis TaxID=632 RepID=A0AAV3BI53_YERPE